jgi:hypothetical protein
METTMKTLIQRAITATSLAGQTTLVALLGLATLVLAKPF